MNNEISVQELCDALNIEARRMAGFKSVLLLGLFVFLPLVFTLYSYIRSMRVLEEILLLINIYIPLVITITIYSLIMARIGPKASKFAKALEKNELKVAWVYLKTIRHLAYFIPIYTSKSFMFYLEDGGKFEVPIVKYKLEQYSDFIDRNFPQAVKGYSLDIHNLYYNDSQNFYKTFCLKEGENFED